MQSQRQSSLNQSSTAWIEIDRSRPNPFSGDQQCWIVGRERADGQQVEDAGVVERREDGNFPLVFGCSVLCLTDELHRELPSASRVEVALDDPE
jgi:hypothetical protein